MCYPGITQFKFPFTCCSLNIKNKKNIGCLPHNEFVKDSTVRFNIDRLKYELTTDHKSVTIIKKVVDKNGSKGYFFPMSSKF